MGTAHAEPDRSPRLWGGIGQNDGDAQDWLERPQTAFYDLAKGVNGLSDTVGKVTAMN